MVFFAERPSVLEQICDNPYNAIDKFKEGRVLSPLLPQRCNVRVNSNDKTISRHKQRRVQ